jgi:hypothetical protein
MKEPDKDGHRDVLSLKEDKVGQIFVRGLSEVRTPSRCARAFTPNVVVARRMSSKTTKTPLITSTGAFKRDMYLMCLISFVTVLMSGRCDAVKC